MRIAFVLLVIFCLSQANPYIKKEDKKPHVTTTHGKPVPKHQLLPPITEKKPKPKPKPKPRMIINEDGEVVEEKPKPPKPLTANELEIKETKIRCLNDDSGAWCWKLGMYYYEGKITQQDYKEAYIAFEGGCLKKNGGACYGMGFMYEFGRGEVPYDRKKALEFYLKSCNYGYNIGCDAYRRLR